MESKDNKNAILAVVLSGIILFGWNYFFAPTPYVAPQTVKSHNTAAANRPDDKLSSTIDKTVNDLKSSEQIIEEVKIGNDKNWLVINSKLQITDMKTMFAESKSKDIFTTHQGILTIKIAGQVVHPVFEFNKVNENNYTVSDSKNGINGTLQLTELGSLKVNLNAVQEFLPTILLHADVFTDDDDGRKSNKYVYFHDDLEELEVGKTDSDFFESKIKWMGLDYQYHLFAYVLDTTNIYRLDYTSTAMRLASIKAVSEFQFEVFYTKKNYDDLIKLGHNLNKSVDFGMWSIIAVPILRGLQYFYDLFKNYGIAIIVLTIIMRILTFPLQYKSFRSMKKMQVIQPELAKIKEKHKEDPQKMQQETMALFKKAGANPLSGCLPMLAQMPIFFAFYQVLFTSVELVGAPFIFWIHDLSIKDPFYILPILMGLAMFLNMKLTPTTTVDPTQQKMMMFMPIIFSVFMLNLPAGLTLYMLVSTIAGMLQQLLVYRQKT